MHREKKVIKILNCLFSVVIEIKKCYKLSVEDVENYLLAHHTSWMGTFSGSMKKFQFFGHDKIMCDWQKRHLLILFQYGRRHRRRHFLVVVVVRELYTFLHTHRTHPERNECGEHDGAAKEYANTNKMANEL